jgi:hypothetical protein
MQVNDPPSLKPIADKKGVQDAWLNFTIRATEVDLGQDTTLLFGSNVTDIQGKGKPGYKTLRIVKSEEDPLKAEVSFKPENHHVGEFSITFWARDHLDAESNTSVEFSIKNRNDGPVIKEVHIEDEIEPEIVKYNQVNLISKEDEKLNFSLIVDDPDLITPEGETLQFTGNVTYEHLHLDSSTGNISFLPENEDVGNIYIRITVTDYAGLEDYVDIRIRVYNKADDPVILGVQVDNTFIETVEGQIEISNKYGAIQDGYFNFTISVQDEDLAIDKEEVMRFWKNTLDDNFILDPWTGYVEFRPSQADVGEYVVVISVMDKTESQDSVELIIHVSDANDPPPTPTLSVVPKVNNPLEINAMVTAYPILDPDGDVIVCIWDFGDNTEVIEDIDDETKWKVEHIYNEPGLYIISLTLDDTNGGLTMVQRSIQVGELEDDTEPEETGSLGMQGKKTEEDSNIGIILAVLTIVIIVIFIALFFYISSGKKLLEDKKEEDDDDLLDMDFPTPGMMAMGGMGMQQAPGMMQGYGMYGQYMGYPMSRDGTMYGQAGMQMMPGLPAMGTIQQAPSVGGTTTQPPVQGPHLMLPPANQFNICPQCNQAAIHMLKLDGSSFVCTNCGYKV